MSFLLSSELLKKEKKYLKKHIHFDKPVIFFSPVEAT